MSADRALGMVRGWPQLMQSASEVWDVLPADPTVSANGDPIAILAAMGRAVGRSRAAGHWPGRGRKTRHGSRSHRTSCRAWRLPQQQPVASEAVLTDSQTTASVANTQILHALHVAAHATAVAVAGYERDLQDRLEVGARRRQPLVERPPVLEVESAVSMIARFDAIEQLIAGSLAARSGPTGNVGDGQPDAWVSQSFRSISQRRRRLSGPRPCLATTCDRPQQPVCASGTEQGRR
jgi:hypothetical protein